MGLGYGAVTTLRVWFERRLREPRGVGGWHVVVRYGTEAPVLLVEIHHAKICAANVCRNFQHLVEHRGQITGRGADDLQYFGGRYLLLPCLFQVAGKSAYLLLQVGYGWGRGR